MSQSFPGSRWWKFDFHNHTPASSDFDPAEALVLRERDWLLAYMRAEVDCVAVTDHNCADWIGSLQAELVAMRQEEPKAQGFRDLVLFPGVEITTSESIHLLAVFDPGTEKAQLDGLLRGRLTFANGGKPNAEMMCNQSCLDVIQAIHALGGLAIPAHVEQAKGLLNGDVSGGRFVPEQSQRLIEAVLPEVDALEVQNFSSPALAYFSGSTTALAQVSGSDYPHSTANAGRRYSWLKMSLPNLEGIRLALLDPECSVRPANAFNGNPQPMPTRRIERLSLEKLALRRAAPLNVAFSPWYTSVIGGRGSGKSTLVEALRLALARDEELKELGDENEVQKTFSRFRQKYTARDKPGMLLGDTCLAAELAVDRGGALERYRYVWQLSGLNVEQWDGLVWQPTHLNVVQARDLFPVRLFSQKQIYNLAERPQALLAYFDAAPEVDKAGWESDFVLAKNAFLQARERVRELEKTLQNKALLETELREVARKATVFAQAHFADKLQAYQREKQQQTRLQDFSDGIKHELGELGDGINALAGLCQWKLAEWQADRADEQALADRAIALSDAVKRHFSGIQAELAAMQAALLQFDQSPEKAAWSSAGAVIMTDYEQLVAQMRAQGLEGPQQAAQALQRKGVIEKELAVLVLKADELESAKQACKRAYVRLSYQRKILTHRRQAFVNKVLQEAGLDNLRIELSCMEDMAGSKDEFRRLLRVGDGTFVADIWQDEEAGPVGVLGKLLEGETPYFPPLPKRIRQLKENLEDPAEQVLSLGLHGKLQNALKKLSDQDWDALWQWFPEDAVRVSHQHGGSWKNLQQASAGQKTAAILSFLLAHGDEPLVLDQPEDDLDNALVYELVVRQLRDNKARRQLIVVTHNANIVVNGDAELVLPMAVRGGQIVADPAGGLQEREVRVRICDIMEGGREAFKQRYKRIFKDLERDDG